jgi:hypothetical protein
MPDRNTMPRSTRSAIPASPDDIPPSMRSAISSEAGEHFSHLPIEARSDPYHGEIRPPVAEARKANDATGLPA